MFRKILLITLILFLIVYSLFAQQVNWENNYGCVGVTYSNFGDNEINKSSAADIKDISSYYADEYYSIGINYLYPIWAWLDTEFGLEFTQHSITVKTELPNNPGNLIKHSNAYLISVPITLRFNLLKYFFINTGFIGDIDITKSSLIDNQTGFRGYLGFALKYDFDSGIGFFLNPYIKTYSLFPTSIFFDQGRQSLNEGGLRLGLTYKLRGKSKKEKY